MIRTLMNYIYILGEKVGVYEHERRSSFSQTGEDIIIMDFFKYEMKKEKIRYLDIGANDPKFLSNTYLMYKEGNQGILVEPNIELCKRLRKYRKNDIVLNCGIADQHGYLKYYMMESDKINSFSKEEVEEYIKLGHKLIGEKEIEVFTINEILEKYGKVDFLSLDVEGLDFEILKTLNYTKFSPSVICVETQEYGGDKREDFETINNFLFDNGYMIYADTMLNTIYVKRNIFEGTRRRN